jgi:signal transduction histidine kinase
MHPIVLIPLAACVLGTMGAGAILARDPTDRINRLVAATLCCSAWWSLCEVIWNIQQDPEVVLWLIQASAFGWVPLGALALDVFTVIEGDQRSRLRRLVPVAYASAAVGILLYTTTPWCLSEVVRTGWGWGYRIGPLFPFVYVAAMGWVLLVLVNWPRLFTGGLRERRQARWLFVGLAVPGTVASITDVLLPYLDIQVPRLGSTSILALGGVAASTLRRHGYFLLAPSAFAREILETLHDGVALLHPDGRIRTCNGGLARLVGAGADALQGRPIAELLPGLPAGGPSSLRELKLGLQSAVGTTIPVSVSSSLLRQRSGAGVGHVFTIRDLREVTELRNRLMVSGRLAAVGELAAGIAHEIGSPISSVRSKLLDLHRYWQAFTDAAPKHGAGAELATLLAEGEELIEESVEGVARVASIVGNVGAFSRAGRGDSELVDVTALLDNAVGVAVLSHSVVVERCLGELPPVRCNAQQIKQVFLNVLLNALQAVGESGRIRLVTQARGGWVSVRIQDDGAGIPESDLERIFDPFFTTRPTGEGLGLGLAHSFQILRHHGGEISATSEPGCGTTVEVRLPAARDG